GFEDTAFPAAVAGVVGELHGVDRPHLDAEPLQGKHGRRIADMAVGDVGLDGEEVHDLPAAPPSSPAKAAPPSEARGRRGEFKVFALAARLRLASAKSDPVNAGRNLFPVSAITGCPAFAGHDGTELG